MEEAHNVYKHIKTAFVNADDDETEELLDEIKVETVQTLVVFHPEGSQKEIERYPGI